MAEQKRRALVVGLGIAGMSAAIGLRDAGWVPVIVERSPERRTGGYFIGVFPPGKEAMRDLGADKYLHVRNGSGTDWHVDRAGNSTAGAGFLDRPGGPYAVVRGDIEAALWRTMHGDPQRPGAVPAVEVRYGTVPEKIVDGPTAVTVTLADSVADRTYTEDFDLVVGADGLRSTVRSLVFGPHSEFIKQWDAIICAYELQEPAPGFAAQDGIIDAQPGRAAWTFSYADRAPTVLLTYRTKQVDEQFTRPRIESLRTAFEGMNHPGVRHALDSLESAPDYLFDSANQVRMPYWHRGRVVLVGDSAWCLTLYSGMGASSAMRGGADLGLALRAHPDDLAAALAAWEKGLRPFITRHTYLARLMQQFFVPSGPVAASLRGLVLKGLGLASRLKSKAQSKPGGGNSAEAAAEDPSALAGPGR